MDAYPGVLSELSGSSLTFLNPVAACDLRVFGRFAIPLGPRSPLATLSVGRSVNNR